MSYRTNDLEPWVLPSVRTAEKILANNESLNKEYLPILGLEEFNFASTKLLLGRDSPAITTNRVFSVQTLSATGALRVGAEFLIRVMGKQIIYYSNPTWENHKLIFKNVGFLERREYRYWSHTNRGLDLDGLLEDLRDAPEGSVIVFHAVAHNPSGCDPTPKQWEQIAKSYEGEKTVSLF
ncbi:hypothetical protein NQ317_016226 [Molorchus minor]|uniref:aspartate transaminase n=1 Tax=Molorchus minor TaxID=1323400 RepID=A0ABQ9IVX7_9CUCU|nr:hypothetical protein NQ317_016226 [Molorchus minor]